MTWITRIAIPSLYAMQKNFESLRNMTNVIQGWMYLTITYGNSVQQRILDQIVGLSKHMSPSTVHFQHYESWYWEASSSLIEEYIKSKFIGTGRDCRSKEICQDVCKELGLNMSNEKALRAKKYARASVLGMLKEFYPKLLLWSAVLVLAHSLAFRLIWKINSNIIS